MGDFIKSLILGHRWMGMGKMKLARPYSENFLRLGRIKHIVDCT